MRAHPPCRICPPQGAQRTPGGNGTSTDAAARREILEVEADKKADDEYAHMNPVAKWVMEAKAALYSWLKTGVEV